MLGIDAGARMWALHAGFHAEDAAPVAPVPWEPMSEAQARQERALREVDRDVQPRIRYRQRSAP